MKRVLIKDVAALAGASPATVSKVLNDVPDSGIPEETAERVRRAACDLGYFPSSPARALRCQRTQTIAIVTHDLTPFTAEIIKGVEGAAQAYDLTTVWATHKEDNDLEAKQLLMGLRGQVDGLIVVPARCNRNQRLYDELKRRQVPFVFVDRYVPDYEANYVGTCNEEAAYRLTQALIAQGAQVIACVSGMRGNTALQERCAGYHRALQEAGLPMDWGLLGPAPGESQAEGVQRLLSRRPRVEGVFWSSYQYIQPHLALFRSRGLRVPYDILFAGFDKITLSVSSPEDYDGFSVLCAPCPTAVQPGCEMGCRALELLVQHFGDGATMGMPQRVILEPTYECMPTMLHLDPIQTRRCIRRTE
ncbi:MAG: LacI family DNA-binding transcriptional regulator [Anaerolineae bacterium]